MGNSTSKTKAASGSEKQNLTIGLSVFFALVIVGVIIALALTLGGSDGTCDPKCDSGTHCVCIPDSSGPSDGSGPPPCTDTSDALCCGKDMCSITNCCAVQDGSSGFCRKPGDGTNTNSAQCYSFVKTKDSKKCSAMNANAERIIDSWLCEAAGSFTGKGYEGVQSEKLSPFGCNVQGPSSGGKLKFNTCCQISSDPDEKDRCYDGSMVPVLTTGNVDTACSNTCGSNKYDQNEHKCECAVPL